MSADCIICYTTLLNGNTNLAVPCGHVYHEACLTEWIKVSKTCPQCRQAVNIKKAMKLFFSNTVVENITQAEPERTTDTEDNVKNGVEDIIRRLIDLCSDIEDTRTINRHTKEGFRQFRTRFMAITEEVNLTAADLAVLSYKIHDSSTLFPVLDDDVHTAEQLLKAVKEQLEKIFKELIGA